MEKKYLMKKIERQLLIYHIFMHNYCVQYDTIKFWLKMDDSQVRTFYRDLKELNDSGLIKTYYDREKKGYIDEGMTEVNHKASGRYREHLIRLNRVGRCMCELTQDEVDETLLEAQIYDKEWWEKECGSEENIDVGMLHSCKDCYRELFPEVSERTMQRDFKLLNNIGYVIQYNPNFHYYHMDFPEQEDLIVSIVKEKDGKLYLYHE